MSYRPRYEVEVRHRGLNKYRHISGTDKYIVEEKARAQLAAWEEQWQSKVQVLQRREERERKSAEKEARRALALEKTEEAISEIAEAQNLLSATLRINDAINFDSIKDQRNFTDPEPAPPRRPKYPKEPQRTDAAYAVTLNLFDHLLPSRRAKKESASQALFQSDRQKWQKAVAEIDSNYERDLSAYEQAMASWQKRRQIFYQERERQHASVDALEKRYLCRSPDAIEEYCDMVLARSQYPNWCPKEFEIAFNDENRMLVVDYRLPSLTDLPKTKEIKYIASRDALEERPLRPSDLNALYDQVVYQICLRTIHEVYEADTIDAINAVVFNGWVEFIDPSSGNETKACIVSVQAEKETFQSINLSQIEPKACFKALKGVGSAKLHGMVAVPPLVRMNRDDARFVESLHVADKLHEGTNVAAMSWEDFEHLVREIFEKLFARDGGEVKVTRASRDGGVDAVAFDPDPIRGGKIVIQAKRYTGTVGVSAVRDLYGTVMNEGATKGILVTTASFGPDAYAFAKDKPLTLLDGGNLLHLLQQYGHKAYIDLKEAKELNANR